MSKRAVRKSRKEAERLAWTWMAADDEREEDEIPSQEDERDYEPPYKGE